jgi:predicted nucleic acid-binding Zn ribbon protein
MKLNELFKLTDAYWARYDAYEWREFGGKLYLTPTATSKVAVYDPIKVADDLIVDAVNVGMQCMYKQSGDVIREHIRGFAEKYGLLGLMPALPLAQCFTNYSTVFLPVNHVTNQETMDTNEYVDLFFPFSKPNFRHDGKQSEYHIDLDHNDKQQTALFMTFNETSMAIALTVRRDYAEQYKWLVEQFANLAYYFYAGIFFYNDNREADEYKDLYRKGMEAFACNAPQYRIRLYDDKPQIKWEFNSLWQTIQTIFGFALTDEERPMRMCKSCSKAYISQDPRNQFCSPECKKRYGVAQNRKRKQSSQ